MSLKQSTVSIIGIALTIFASVIGSALVFSYTSGQSVQEIRQSIDQLKNEVSQVNTSLKDLRKDSIQFKVQNSRNETRIQNIERRVGSLQNKLKIN